MNRPPAPPRILVRQLALDACIGVHDWEKAEPQPVLLDLEMDLDPHLGEACRTDCLDDTVDYSRVIDLLRGVARRPHALAEAMAHRMCMVVLEHPGVRRVRLTLLKLGPFPGAQVGVVLDRERPAVRRHDADALRIRVLADGAKHQMSVARGAARPPD